jgi:hypothetical protein
MEDLLKLDSQVCFFFPICLLIMRLQIMNQFRTSWSSCSQYLVVSMQEISYQVNQIGGKLQLDNER